MEVDLEKGFPKVVNLYMDGWEHMQKVDCKHLPFKCKKCHEYGHFVKNFPKVVNEIPEKIKMKDGNRLKEEEKCLHQPHYQVDRNQRQARKSLKKGNKL